MSRNTRVLLIVIGAFLAVGGYWKLALKPKRAEAATLAHEVATQQAQLAQQQTLLASYQGKQAAYKTNFAQVVRLGTAVPADDDSRSLVVQLDAAAKRSGTAFDNFDISAHGSSSSAGPSAEAPGAVNAGNYSALPLSLSFSGDFDTLQNFLGRVQRFVTLKGDQILVNGRLMRVESVSLAPAETGWPSMSVQIAADAYIVPDDVPAPDASSAASAATTTSTTTTTTSASASDKPGSVQ